MYGDNNYLSAPAAPMPPQTSGTSASANAEEVRAIAEVKAQVSIAKQFPRDFSASLNRILDECKRPTLAKQATYSYPRGKDTVTGPSIRLAEVMARNWGNFKMGIKELERKSDSTECMAYAWDLESNNYVEQSFTVRHWRDTKSGGYKLTDDRDIYELSANMGARRMRSCILRIIPGDVTDAAVNACRMTLNSNIVAAMENPKERENCVRWFIGEYEKIGVVIADLEEYLKTKVQDWTADHIIKLQELQNALADNFEQLGEVFPRLATLGKNDVVSKEQAAELMSLAKDSGRQQDVQTWLKSLGISKVADIPTARFEEIKAYIINLSAKEETSL